MKEELHLSVVLELQTQNGKPAGDSEGNKYLYAELKAPVSSIAEAADTGRRVKAALNPVKPLEGPLTLRDEDADHYVEGVVELELHELVDGDYESLLDCLSYKLVGDTLLMTIEYSIVGFSADGNAVYVKVVGDASQCFLHERLSV